MGSIIRATCDVCKAESDPFDPEVVQYPPGWWVVTVTTDRKQLPKRLRQAAEMMGTYAENITKSAPGFDVTQIMDAFQSALLLSARPVILSYDLCPHCRGKGEDVFRPIYSGVAREVPEPKD